MTQPTVPTEILEMRAAEQRRTLLDRVEELKMTVKAEVRERTDVQRQVKRHFAPIAGAIAVIGLAAGYGFAGIFTRD